MAEEGLRELALFAGAGGGILGGKLLGWRCVAAVEKDPYCREVLLRRQLDGCLPRFPIWDDVCTFAGFPWRGRVDVVTGGFPCQDISVAGTGAGLDGDRSGLWMEQARIIGEVRPRFAVMENSPALTARGLHRVLGDLAEMGYDATWGIVSAEDAIIDHCHPALPAYWHERKRIWVLAYSDGIWQPQPQRHYKKEWGWIGNILKKNADVDGSGQWERGAWEAMSGRAESQDKAGNTYGQRRQKQRSAVSKEEAHASAESDPWWAAEPGVVRVVHGLPHRVDRIRALGNAQVPLVVRLAWDLLHDNLAHNMHGR